MVTTDLGACEWFVWDMRRSNLLDRGVLDQIVGEFLEKEPRAEPAQLAEYLIQQGILTPFQAERLLKGKTQGFVLGPFTLMDALGSGSMGTVYKAKNKNDNQWYAVKVLPRRSMWNVRLAKRKVRAFEQCRHPAIMPFVDVGTSGGMHYLAWAFVEGETLDKVVAVGGPLPPAKAACFVLQTAEGLVVCHEQGLFHGLLKPSNLMISQDQQVRILDFGIGSLLAETEGESLVDTMSTANSISSGLDCASPESVMDPSNLTPLGDQYSLGCVLYYCLSGRFPFPDGSTADKMLAHQFKQPIPLKDIAPETPESLIGVVDRLMQKMPESRYSSMAEVIQALRPFSEDSPQATQPQERIIRSERPATPVSPQRQSNNGNALRPQQAVNVAGRAESASAAPSLVRNESTRAPAPRPANRDPSVSQLAKDPVHRVQANSERPATPAKTALLPQPASPDYTKGHSEERSLEDRIGPMGVAAIAIILCAAAWLVTWKLF